MFHFSYDPDEVLLTVVQQGYWTIEEYREYEAQYLRRIQDIRRKHPRLRILADCRGYAVQSAEVGEAFRLFSNRLMVDHEIRCAIVADQTLGKLQAQRAMPQNNIRVFLQEDEARAWLFAD